MSSSHPSSSSSQPEGLSDGSGSERVQELLRNSVHSGSEDTLMDSQAITDSDNDNDDDQEKEEEEHRRELAARAKLPWWKRPSPLWMYLGVPISQIGFSSTLAPRVEIYTNLVCRVLRPEYVSQSGLSMGSLSSHSNPVPQAFEPPDAPIFSSLEPLLPAYEFSNNTVFLNFAIPAVEVLDQQQCAKDPVVQGAVATLVAVISTSMGILGCITGAWWGSLSDRFGRTRVMALSVFGLLATDTNFLFVNSFADRLPGNYWFLVFGPLVEGFFGGIASGGAALHAYLADSVDPSARSRQFSLSLGLGFIGMAVGPVIGGLLIRATHQALSVFYFATVLHAIYVCYLWFIVPESLTRARRAGAIRRHALERRKEVIGHWALRGVKQVLGFLKPITILFPQRVSSNDLSDALVTNPLKHLKRDWNLCLVAASYGFFVSVMGSFTYKFQYAIAKFGWTSELISYYVALSGAVRAAFLTILLPLAIKFILSRPAIQLPVTPSEPLESSSPAPCLARSRSPNFDLNIARFSVLLDAISYTFTGVATSPDIFAAFTIMLSLGTGFSPALQSVALELYVRRGGKSKSESGKLFGAISVVQALSSQIISPAVYGFLYFQTVASFPQAIFYVSSLTAVISSLLLTFVRIPEVRSGDIEEQNSENDAELPTVVVTSEDTVIDVGGQTTKVVSGLA